MLLILTLLLDGAKPRGCQMKLLFTTLTSNDLGLLTRSLPIAVELAKRGHQVAFCNPANAPSKLIAQTGFDNLFLKHPLFYVPMTGELDLRGLYRQFKSERFRREFGNLFSVLIKLARAAPTRFPSITPDVWNMDHFAALIGMLNENFVRASYEAFMALMREYDPDIIVDFWNPFACLAARAVQKSLVTIIQADLHPASRGFIWWKEPAPDMPIPVSIVNKILAEHNLQPISKMAQLFVGDLTLILGMPETDPLPQKTEAIYIGPILWQKSDAKTPDWFGALSKDKPVVWVYSGNPRYMPISTPLDSAIILHACTAALADEDVQVVLTTGHHALPKRILPLPANFRYESFVPGLAMAKRSDLLIHHGGYGSCQTGLYTGTPAVIIPTYSERESNARRIAAVGAGEFIVPTEDTSGKRHVRAEELRAKVRQVLSDPAYTMNARRVSEKMQTYGGASEAAHLIEDLGQVRNSG
jgi:UDP:flavonoid glycosyltransferase YjiC (YdhE family)